MTGNRQDTGSVQTDKRDDTGPDELTRTHGQAMVPDRGELSDLQGFRIRKN